MLRYKKQALLFALVILLSACARGPNPQDPYEHFNRNTYRMNDKIDRAILKPVAKGYQKITPYAVRHSVDNFFDNFNEPRNIGNDILQGRVYWTFNDSWRFIVNTTAGVVGLFDVASEIGLKDHQNNFGLTLDSWGYKHPAYVVTPLLGPSTASAVIGIPVDYTLVPWNSKISMSVSVPLFVMFVVNTRALYLDQEDLTDQLAFDPYIFLRNAYLQHRAYLININEHPPLRNQDTETMQTPIATQAPKS